MQDFDAPCLEDRADWIRLLHAYAQAEELAAAAEAAQLPVKPRGPRGRRKAAEVQESVVLQETPVAAGPELPELVDPQTPEGDGEGSRVGWVPRVPHIEGVEPTRMSALHGKLIALGYLKFQLIDRQVGLRYRLTPAGQQLVKSETAQPHAA